LRIGATIDSDLRRSTVLLIVRKHTTLMERIEFLTSKSEKTAYQKRAKESSLSVSAWIRITLKAKLLNPELPGTTKVDLTPIIDEIRSIKRTIASFEFKLPTSIQADADQWIEIGDAAHLIKGQRPKTIKEIEAIANPRWLVGSPSIMELAIERLRNEGILRGAKKFKYIL